VLNLIFFLTIQNLIFAIQNNGLKSRLALLVNDYDILEIGDQVPSFQLSTNNGTTINIEYNMDNAKITLLYLLKPSCSACKENIVIWNNILLNTDSATTRIYAVSIDSLHITHEYEVQNSIPFKLYSNFTDNFLLNYKPFLTPQTILIDKNGIVLSNWKGILTENSANEIIYLLTREGGQL
jgi:peroxiredoxin